MVVAYYGRSVDVLTVMQVSGLPVCAALLFLLQSPPMLISAPVLLLPADVHVMSLVPFVGSSSTTDP